MDNNSSNSGQELSQQLIDPSGATSSMQGLGSSDMNGISSSAMLGGLAGSLDGSLVVPNNFATSSIVSNNNNTMVGMNAQGLYNMSSNNSNTTSSNNNSNNNALGVNNSSLRLNSQNSMTSLTMPQMAVSVMNMGGLNMMPNMTNNLGQMSMPMNMNMNMNMMSGNMNNNISTSSTNTMSNIGTMGSMNNSINGSINNGLGSAMGISATGGSHTMLSHSLPMASNMFTHHHYGNPGSVNSTMAGSGGATISGGHIGQASAHGSLPFSTMRDTGSLNLSAESLPDDDSDLNQLTEEQHDQRLFEMLHRFWESQTRDMNILDISTEQDFKNHNDLPLARIKRIMKSDEDVRMISAEAPVLFAKACEMFILELSIRSWGASEKCKRRTLLKEDVEAAIKNTDIFDFLDGLS
jgi:histone H3/H4